MSRKQGKSTSGQTAEKKAPHIVSTEVKDLGAEDPYKSIRYNRNTQLENQKLALTLLDATESVPRLSF